MNLNFSESTLPTVKSHVARYIQQNKDNAELAARIVLTTGTTLSEAFLRDFAISNSRAAAAYDIQEKLLYMERVIQNPEFSEAGRQHEAEGVARYFNAELIRLTRVSGDLNSAGVYMDVISYLS
jgi:hypothetical protein